ncbi:hypothetical protein [Streptomyces sp. NPDC006289]|uniref:SCO6745 family protein n=1 Tax=Streptomyces sp. NPDC006289 TaxID=3156744 RepID=UPI0033AE2883
MSDELGYVRRMWHLLEPLHAVVYYAPEAFEEAAALGYATDERWPSYFAWRAAPLGAAGADRVAETFFGFSPTMIARYVPAGWSVAAPEAVLAARTRAVDRMYRALFSERVHGPELAEAAGLVRRAAQAAEVTGRPLAEAAAALPWPDAPHLVLWQAATVLREHRGDGHLEALASAGLDPVESLVSFAAVGAARPEVFGSRGWSEAEWSAGRGRLQERGLLEEDGTATGAGRALRAEVERRTDELAAGPWDALTPTERERLVELLGPLWVEAISSGLLPSESTLGIGKV